MLILDNDPYTQPSFSFSHRFFRFIWGVVYCSLFYFSPRPLHCWRSFLLRLFGAKIGKNCHVYPKVNVWAPWNLRLGDFVGVGDGVRIYNMNIISIGDYSVISQGAHLCGGTHDYNSENFQLLTKPIIIDKRVWVCADSFIHPGVTISEGCVVGARSVVNKDLDVPWGVYSGNPCRLISERSVRF